MTYYCFSVHLPIRTHLYLELNRKLDFFYRIIYNKLVMRKSHIDRPARIVASEKELQALREEMRKSVDNLSRPTINTELQHFTARLLNIITTILNQMTMHLSDEFYSAYDSVNKMISEVVQEQKKKAMRESVFKEMPVKVDYDQQMDQIQTFLNRRKGLMNKISRNYQPSDETYLTSFIQDRQSKQRHLQEILDYCQNNRTMGFADSGNKKKQPRKVNIKVGQQTPLPSFIESQCQTEQMVFPLSKRPKSISKIQEKVKELGKPSNRNELRVQATKSRNLMRRSLEAKETFIKRLSSNQKSVSSNIIGKNAPRRSVQFKKVQNVASVPTYASLSNSRTMENLEGSSAELASFNRKQQEFGNYMANIDQNVHEFWTPQKNQLPSLENIIELDCTNSDFIKQSTTCSGNGFNQRSSGMMPPVIEGSNQEEGQFQSRRFLRDGALDNHQRRQTSRPSVKTEASELFGRRTNKINRKSIAKDLADRNQTPAIKYSQTKESLKLTNSNSMTNHVKTKHRSSLGMQISDESGPYKHHKSQLSAMPSLNRANSQKVSLALD